MEASKNSEKYQKRNIRGMSEYDMMTLTDQAAYTLRTERNQKMKELGRKLNSAENRELFNNVMIQIVNQYSNLKGRLKDVKVALGSRLSERSNRKGKVKKTTGEQKQQTASELTDTLSEKKRKPIFSKEQIQRMKMDSLNVIRARHGDPID